MSSLRHCFHPLLVEIRRILSTRFFLRELFYLNFHKPCCSNNLSFFFLTAYLLSERKKMYMSIIYITHASRGVLRGVRPVRPHRAPNLKGPQNIKYTLCIVIYEALILLICSQIHSKIRSKLHPKSHTLLPALVGGGCGVRRGRLESGSKRPKKLLKRVFLSIYSI